MLKPSDLDVAYVAKLARLNLTDAETELFQRQLGDVLKYADKLRAVDVSHVEAAAHTIPIFNVFREDERRDWLTAEKANVDLPLGGVPIAIKDIISVSGESCTCTSKILRGYLAPYDATVIRKLRAAGAIPFGKTNMDEFAMGSSTENSGVKLTRNPWDLSRVPGGS